MAALLPQFCGAFAAGLVAGAVETGDNSTGAIVLGAYLVAGWYSARAARWRWLLPMAGLLSYVIMAVLGTILSIAALLAFGESPSFLPLALAAFAAWAALVITNSVFSPATRIRIGVIGSPHSALRLREELDREQSRGFEVGATIVPDDWDFDPSALDAPYLCALSQIGAAIDDRDLEALVVTREFDRSEVDRRLFAEVVARPVQVMELHEFHEHRFGSVPLAEIDYAWFTRLAGSHYKPLTRALKRGLDLIVAIPAAIILAPVVGVTALFVKRDGGPVLFRQERIGQGGKPFLINKLRTMTDEPGVGGRVGGGRRRPRHRNRALPSQEPSGRGPAALERDQGRHESRRPPARAGGVCRGALEGNPVLHAAPRRQAGHHGLGPGEGRLRRIAGGDRVQALQRPLLRQAPLACRSTPRSCSRRSGRSLPTSSTSSRRRPASRCWERARGALSPRPNRRPCRAAGPAPAPDTAPASPTGAARVP